MNNGIKKAMDRFNLREQAQAQSDRDPWLPYPYGTNGTVAPLQGRLNTRSKGTNENCCCQSVCSDCIEYQMTLNQAH